MNTLHDDPQKEDFEDETVDVDRELEIIKEIWDECEKQNEVDEAVAATCQAICRSPQDVQYDLLFATGISNGLNGFTIARDLRENEHLWDGFIIGRYDHATALPLRDLKDRFWNADTLLILAKDHTPQAPDNELDTTSPIYNEDDLDELWELAAGWGPVSLEWVPYKEAGKMIGIGGISRKFKLLRAWWD